MAPPARPRIVIGLDVGKSAHWARVVTRGGELPASGPIPNRESAIDGLYAQYPGALVVVDRVRNIGSLALSRAKLAGVPRAHLPGLAAHGASRLFAGDAKTDERDAMVMAKTALGIPDALPAVADRPPEIGAARSLAAQRDFSTCESARSKNRLRSISLESCPEFEAQADLSDPATLKLMAAVGGPWSMSGASPQAVGALARGCRRAKVAALVESVESSSGPRPAAVACEDRAVRLLARRISENAAEMESLASEISAPPAADETCRCLLTVPGIGPRTASELVISIDIADFAGRDGLASRRGARRAAGGPARRYRRCPRRGRATGG
ncbi:IS110 family transposase [Ellagibacter isourolithinifaciens]|uniref:IS110 family transposase n=1 Tax=Ellagibacter isourolithinifaciens TaxID=2137581 RepID=UPI003AB0A057